VFHDRGSGASSKHGRWLMQHRAAQEFRGYRIVCRSPDRGSAGPTARLNQLRGRSD
jgi:hypothetical protein